MFPTALMHGEKCFCWGLFRWPPGAGAVETGARLSLRLPGSWTPVGCDVGHLPGAAASTDSMWIGLLNPRYAFPGKDFQDPFLLFYSQTVFFLFTYLQCFSAAGAHKMNEGRDTQRGAFEKGLFCGDAAAASPV